MEFGAFANGFLLSKKPWYAGQFVRRITPKIEIKESSILFFTTLLNKQKPKLLSVLVRDVDAIFRAIKIYLPTINGKIDFDFMESFIAELEAQHIADLEAQRTAKLESYLSVTGLKDTQLSLQEKEALHDFDKLNWGEFNLEVLFGKSTRGKRLKSADRIPGKLPFVTAGEADEGISAFIGNPSSCFLQKYDNN